MCFIGADSNSNLSRINFSSSSCAGVIFCFTIDYCFSREGPPLALMPIPESLISLPALFWDRVLSSWLGSLLRSNEEMWMSNIPKVMSASSRSSLRSLALVFPIYWHCCWIKLQFLWFFSWFLSAESFFIWRLLNLNIKSPSALSSLLSICGKYRRSVKDLTDSLESSPKSIPIWSLLPLSFAIYWLSNSLKRRSNCLKASWMRCLMFLILTAKDLEFNFCSSLKFLFFNWLWCSSDYSLIIWIMDASGGH